jgi:hypothetical protein
MEEIGTRWHICFLQFSARVALFCGEDLHSVKADMPTNVLTTIEATSRQVPSRVRTQGPIGSGSKSNLGVSCGEIT